MKAAEKAEMQAMRAEVAALRAEVAAMRAEQAASRWPQIVSVPFVQTQPPPSWPGDHLGRWSPPYPIVTCTSTGGES